MTRVGSVEVLMNRSRVFGRSVIFFMLLLVAAWIQGCIEMSIRTKIEPSGKCTESYQITTNPMFAEGLKSELKKKEIDKQGYKVETRTEGEKVHLIYSKDFASVQEMYNSRRFDPIEGMEDGKGSESRAKGDYKVQDLVFVKTMTFREVIPKKEKPNMPATTPQDKQMEDMGRQLASSVLSIKRVVQMPGPIIASNADNVDKSTNTATWNMSADKFFEGFTFEAKSRIVNIPAIAGAVIVLLGAIIFAILSLTRKVGSAAGESKSTS
jgi:hypothetical protein